MPEFTTILSTQTLAQHLQDPDWLVVDCRFDLAKPHWGVEEYLKTHIPGAVFADLDHDLTSPIMPTSGRHPLPDPDRWRETVTRWGITPETQVVPYDVTGGSLAAVRAWWLLRAYGHARVAVLDGGYPKWLLEGRPVTADLPQRKPLPFTAQFDASQLVTTDELLPLLDDPAHLLVDARAAERFRGEVEPIDPVAGHIPGAMSRPVAQNLNPDQTFKSPEQLRAEFRALLGEISAENIIAYCGSGVTGGHNLLALEIAGLGSGRLYAGSWSEWIRDPKRPIAKGA